MFVYDDEKVANSKQFMEMRKLKDSIQFLSFQCFSTFPIRQYLKHDEDLKVFLEYVYNSLVNQIATDNVISIKQLIEEYRHFGE